MFPIPSAAWRAGLAMKASFRPSRKVSHSVWLILWVRSNSGARTRTKGLKKEPPKTFVTSVMVLALFTFSGDVVLTGNDDGLGESL